MMLMQINFQLLVKNAVAGTGGANDAELSVLIIISFLAVLLLAIVSIKFFKQWKEENNRKKLFGNPDEDTDSEENYDVDFFE